MGRDEEDGPDHGQRFYNLFIKPNLEKNEKVEIIFDGVDAFGSSFLDEAFNEMPSQEGVSRNKFEGLITIIAKEHAYVFYKAMAEHFMQKIPK